MRIIIVGGGKAGARLTKTLSDEGHDITVVDPNPDRLNEICDENDILGVIGNGLNYATLQKAELTTADLLIAMTGSDEKNLLCCLFARKKCNCSTIARVRNPMYISEIPFIKEQVNLSMIINPEYAAAREVARILRFPSAIEINPFSKGKVEMLTFKIPAGSVLDGKDLVYVRSKIETGVLFCSIERGEEFFIPSGDFVLRGGDKASVILKPREAVKFFKRINLATQEVKSVIIAGGGMMTYYLARQLLDNKVNVKIIELNEKRCLELVELLPGAMIIQGDASNRKLLLEEGIDTADAFIALTGFDEENIILSLYAKELSDIKVVTKIDRIIFDDLIAKLNLDTVIYPHDITVENILQYVRAKQNALGNNIETLYRFTDNKLEALEFKVFEGAPNLGIPLKDIKLKKNLIIGAINRREQILLPDGEALILPGDRVIVVTTQKKLNDFKDIFA